jgi:hypothetical protein
MARVGDGVSCKTTVNFDGQQFSGDAKPTVAVKDDTLVTLTTPGGAGGKAQAASEHSRAVRPRGLLLVSAAWPLPGEQAAALSPGSGRRQIRCGYNSPGHS